MKITYDLECLPERHSSYGGKKSEEVLAIIAFLAGKQKNMRIEYDDLEECKRKYNSLRSYRRTAKLQDVFELFRHENSIYIVRMKKPGTKRKATPGDATTEDGKAVPQHQ